MTHCVFLVYFAWNLFFWWNFSTLGKNLLFVISENLLFKGTVQQDFFTPDFTLNGVSGPNSHAQKWFRIGQIFAKLSIYKIWQNKPLLSMTAGNHKLSYRQPVEASETRGTTALVYCLINSSLYRYCTRVVEYTPTCLTVSRGVASSPQTHTFDIL